jgi:hypothetical protein
MLKRVGEDHERDEPAARIAADPLRNEHDQAKQQTVRSTWAARRDYRSNTVSPIGHRSSPVMSQAREAPRPTPTRWAISTSPKHLVRCLDR